MGTIYDIDGSGRGGTDIDTVEDFLGSNKVHQAIHSDGYGPGHQTQGADTSVNNAGGWHTE